MRKTLVGVPGITHVTVVRELGQPSLTIEPDRDKIARYGLNVADINTLIETAVGGAAATQVIQGERSFDLVVRLQEPFRENLDAIRNLLVSTPDGQYLPLSQFAAIRVDKGASFIYRESNERFIGVQFSVEGRDLAGAVQEARAKVAAAVSLPIGYTYDWGGEYQEYLAARSQMALILPLTGVLILLILFALYGNLKFPVIIMFSVILTVPVGGLLALKLTGTNFSVSSGFGFVALMGVAVQTSVILYSFINKLRLEGKDLADGRVRRVAVAAAADHDDGARGVPRPPAGGDVDRDRQRFPEALRDRHRRRPDFAAGAVCVSGAGALRARGQGRRHPEGVTGGGWPVTLRCRAAPRRKRGVPHRISCYTGPVRGDSVRDFYAKTLALIGLGVLAGTGALVDYWPVTSALPVPGQALQLPALASALPVPDGVLVAMTGASPAAMHAHRVRAHDCGPRCDARVVRALRPTLRPARRAPMSCGLRRSTGAGPHRA